MQQPSLHPAAVTEPCEPRKSFGMTVRRFILVLLCLLAAGLLPIYLGRNGSWWYYGGLGWEVMVVGWALIGAIRQDRPLAGTPAKMRFNFAFGLTGRTLYLLAAGFLLLIPGYYRHSLAYAMLAWDALILVAALLDGLRLPNPASIAAGRKWLSAPSLGTSVEIELSISHPNPILLECRLIDDLPPQLIETPIARKLRVWPRLPATQRYTVRPRERGDVHAGEIYLRYRSVLGLVSRWAKAPLEQSIRIYPELRTAEDQQIYLAKSRRIDLQLRQLRHRGLGREFESLREYRPGDDLRDLCWTASARRGDLVTRQFQAERSQSV